jgi:tetratricopeptide (TPR) repeat protein
MPELQLEVPSLEPAQERRLVYASVARFLGNVAGPGGTVLLLDDLQWASADALELLTALVRSRPTSPLRVVGAYRDTEMRSEDPLSVVLSDLAHARLISRLPIGPISSEAATDLLDELLPDLPRTESERRILVRSGGVPFFLISCAQDLRDGSLGGPERDVPWDVAQSVRQRIAGLAPEARDVLGAAAVVGRTVPVDILLAVAAGDGETMLKALDAACNARVLEAAGPDAYRFSHHVFREVVGADLGPARRVVLHRRAAQTLERRPRAGSVEAVVYHYERSGDFEQTAIWAERAGDRATTMYASSDAIEQYERARGALEEIGGQPETLARLDEKLGAPLNMSGQFDRAIKVLERALATYRSLDDDERVRSVSARIGKTYFESGYPLKGLDYVEPLLDDKTESPGTASLLVVLAHLLWRSLRYQDSLAAAERAANLAKRFGNRQLLAEADARRGTALWKLGRWREGQAVMERTADLAQSIGDLEVTSRTLSNLGELQLLRGNLAAARDLLERALDSVERRKGPPGIVYNTTLFGRLLFVAGSWREARERLSEAIEITQTFSEAWVAAYPRLERARLDLAEGRWQGLASELADCRRLGKKNNDPQAIGLADALSSELNLAEG